MEAKVHSCRAGLFATVVTMAEMYLCCRFGSCKTLAMLFFAARYIYKEKKKGTACIGCPYAGNCQKKQQMKDCCK